ncbi:MAG TPA: universal stress protein [Candidatus Eisenbacteria bacterium]|nr:universal stress protein [Candidatus Eisenbacteria bacterium]
MSTDSPFRRLLFAVDGSETSRLALPLVAAYASAWGADLHLLHVHPAAAGPASDDVAGALLSDMVRALERVGIAASGQVHIVDREPVGPVIARLSRHLEADLVVVGSHGRTGLEALLPAGVSHVVAADLATPVLVARAAPGQRPRPGRVLVAIDASPAAELALADAVRVARPTDAAVRVVHVQEPAGARSPLQLEAERDARLVAERGVEAVRRFVLDADAEVVLAGGSIAEAIARAASRFDADLVVVASRRPSDLQAFFVGSVTHDLIHVLGLPVLLAHRA